MKNQKVKPVLFNAPMLQTILEGRKTQTRRVIKLSDGIGGRAVGECGNAQNPIGLMYPNGIKRPAYRRGDVLWIRETWAQKDGHFFYKSGHELLVDGEPLIDKWKPSIHMPREAARIFLQVTYVRAERLQDITWHDLYREGVQLPPEERPETGISYNLNLNKPFLDRCSQSAEDELISFAIQAEHESRHILVDKLKEKFAVLWDSTISKQALELHGWEANPWVWVYGFRMIE